MEPQAPTRPCNPAGSVPVSIYGIPPGGKDDPFTSYAPYRLPAVPGREEAEPNVGKSGRGPQGCGILSHF